ncbi:MAG: alpha/beta hydrolase-fold protein, partial [Clostridiales bacterium]|nr:alpha/beta hydrolase-fold protein [Clostridiales bacterium]
NWGAQADESAYITNIVSGMGGARTWYSTINEYYLVGYGDGGDLLQQYAAANPMFVISQAYFDSAVGADALLVHGNRYYRQENNESSSTTDTPALNVSTFYPVQKKSIPVPTMMIGEGMDADAVKYWLDANECIGASAIGAGPLGSELYTQVNNRAIATSFNDVVAYTAVGANKADYLNIEATEAIYAFLGQYTRYDVSCSFGNALGWRLPTDAYSVEKLTQVVGATTYNREYQIYIPDSAKAIPGGAPILYAFAGMTQPGSLFFDSTQWYDVAAKNGFIVVAPCATTQSNAVNTAWSQSGTGFDRDNAFVKMVMADIDQKYGEYVDKNRVFVTGQSQGGGFAFFLAAANPDMFTAVSYTSAQGVSTSAAIAGDVPPVYFIYGEHDTQQPTNSRTRWLSWHGLDAADGVVYPTGLPITRDNDIGYILNPNSDTFPGTRYAKTSWFKDGIPVVNSVTCLGRSHNNIVSDAWLLWEDWFSKWYRDAQGNREYTTTYRVRFFALDGETLVHEQYVLAGEFIDGNNYELYNSWSNEGGMLAINYKLPIGWEPIPNMLQDLDTDVVFNWKETPIIKDTNVTIAVVK